MVRIASNLGTYVPVYVFIFRQDMTAGQLLKLVSILHDWLPNPDISTT